MIMEDHEKEYKPRKPCSLPSSFWYGDFCSSLGTLDDLKRVLVGVFNAGGETIVVKLRMFDL
jgi:hypothetical protein